MEKEFSKMMEGCMKGVSEEDKKKMIAKFAAKCPCFGKEMSEDDKMAMKEKTSAFLKKAGSKFCCPSNTTAKA